MFCGAGNAFLLATDLQLWSEVRTTLNPGFAMDYLRGCLPAMASGAGNLASVLMAVDGRPINMQVTRFAIMNAPIFLKARRTASFAG